MNGSAQATAPLIPSAAAGRPLDAPLARTRVLWSRYWPFIGFWSIAALVTTNQVYFLWPQKGGVSLSYWAAFVWQGVPWLFWLVATPVLVWLGRRFPLERDTWPKHVAIHLAANITLAPAHLALAAVTGRLAGQAYYLATPFPQMLRHMAAKNIDLEAIIYWGAIAMVHAFEYRRRFREREIVAAQLEARLAHAELQALKMQLHPHFLFNTLHAIAVLVRKQDTQASLRMLTGLSDLLRLALEHAGRQLVPLKQELDFLDRYLEIEKTRFQDRLQVCTTIEPEVLDAEIPNLILQPVAENAIRHGIAPRASGGRVEIAAYREDGSLVVQVRDDGRGFPQGWDASSSAGMGLRNVRARLEQLYNGKHRLEIQAHPDGGAVVTIAVPFRPLHEVADG